MWELMQPRKIRRLAYKSSSSFDCFDLRCLSFFHHRPSFFFLRRWWFDFSLSPFVVRVIRIHWPSLSLVVSLPLLSAKRIRSYKMIDHLSERRTAAPFACRIMRRFPSYRTSFPGMRASSACRRVPPGRRCRAAWRTATRSTWPASSSCLSCIRCGRRRETSVNILQSFQQSKMALTRCRRSLASPSRPPRRHSSARRSSGATARCFRRRAQARRSRS